MVGEGGVGCMALKGIFSFVYFPLSNMENRGERKDRRARDRAEGMAWRIWRAIETEKNEGPAKVERT